VLVEYFVFFALKCVFQQTIHELYIYIHVWENIQYSYQRGTIKYELLNILNC